MHKSWAEQLIRFAIGCEHCDGILQVGTSILAERQSLEMPCVAPSLVGRPHRHAYYQSSRVAQASNWGAPQVNLRHPAHWIVMARCIRSRQKGSYQRQRAPQALQSLSGIHNQARRPTG